MRITRTITRELTSIIALSVMVAGLLAVVAVTQSGTANAQVAGRAISNLQLSHNADHQLTITCDAPIEAPNDYRVMWAKSAESYKTWTDTSGNAFPTTTSHTVTGVERGEEYKVKVRARYDDGSGPWSGEMTYTIPAEPPPNDDPPEDTSDAPTNEANSMPEHIGILDWTDVDDAVRYELEVGIGGSNPGWSDITGTDALDGTRAFVNGSTAIIAVGVPGSYTVRVRAVFDVNSTTDWMVATLRIN